MTFLYNIKINRANNFVFNKINKAGSLPTFSSKNKALCHHSSHFNNSNHYSERPYLYTSLKNNSNLRGSLTIEAAVGFPIFIIVIYAVIRAPAERLLCAGRASPSPAQLLAFAPGKEQAAGVWEP